jgi:hypothetical protein
MAMLGTRDDYARGCNAIGEMLEPLRFPADGRLQDIGMADMLEYDLERHLHSWDLLNWSPHK